MKAKNLAFINDNDFKKGSISFSSDLPAAIGLNEPQTKPQRALKK